MRKFILNIVSHKHFILACLLIGFILRISFCLIYPSGLSPDAQSYYISAINIVNGIGYSDHTEAPYIPFYFREPLTSYFIAICISIYKFIFNIPTIDYPNSFGVSDMVPTHFNIILTIRFVNIILQLSAIYIFYKTIKKVTPIIVARLFFIITCVYYPLIYNVIPLLREGYLLFFFSILFYFWVQYIQLNKVSYVIITAICLGFIAQLLHIYIIMLFLFIPFIIYHQKTIKNKILHCCLFVFCTYAPSIPWIYNVYQFYPDYRIVYTLGSGLSADYINALDAYRAYGVNPYSCKQKEIPEIEIHPEIFDITDVKAVFDNTFSDRYAIEAKNITSITPPEKITNFKIKKYINAFENTVFQIGITYDYDFIFGDYTLKSFIKLLFCLPYIIMGILAICGMFYILRRYWLLLPVFLFHSLLFFALGSEERRQLALIPYIIWFAISFCIFKIKVHKKSL